MPIHFSKIQKVKKNWDIEEILDQQMQTDIITAMMYHTRYWGDEGEKREDGWSMPDESLRLRLIFCEGEDKELDIFRGRLISSSIWIRTSILMEQLNNIIYVVNSSITNKDDQIEPFTKANFKLRFKRLANRLSLSVSEEKSPMTITDPKNKNNTKTLMASGWVGVKMIDKPIAEMTEWERMECGMLDPDDEIVEKTPFDSLF
jgi:hypothetical protein